MSPLNGLALDVRRVLMSRLARGESDIELVARELAMSSRTLQRRLAAVGLSYHELLDRARRETAERSIADSSLSIGEVAYLTGYSEPAAFYRAFRRWTGVTPQVYRVRWGNGRLSQAPSIKPGAAVTRPPGLDQRPSSKQHNARHAIENKYAQCDSPESE
jgi:AraC-like DNA-binding protein